MEAPVFLLLCPPFEQTPEMQAAFEQLLQSTPAGGWIDYALPYPKWQFLSHLCQSQELVLHGSQNSAIRRVEPRQANDIKDFSNQQAIYATTDGIWVIYFAILDRWKYPQMTLFNSCLQARLSPDLWSEPFYFFSISGFALQQKPWCSGAVYILPRQSFIREPTQQVQGMEIAFPHWIGSESTLPVARLRVGPEDFPFLDQIHGHNDEKLVALATANPNGFPWLEALES